MFSRLARLPLRRCLQTRSTTLRVPFTLSRSAKIALGASAATAVYISWQLASEWNTIALDSQRKPQSAGYSQTTIQKSSTPQTGKPHPDKIHSSESPFVNETEADEPQLPNETSSSPPVPEGSSSSSNSEAHHDGNDEEGKAASGAYNPETGEINWDCPCLGGMAHGPCGMEFREAFSCFVFSEDEPKGINCVEKFQQMQDCFRAHPEVYADEIMSDDDDEDAAVAGDGQTNEGHREGAKLSLLEAHPGEVTDKLPSSTSQ